MGAGGVESSLVHSCFALALMTLGYIVGELSHFLIATTSKSVASDIHYGDQACKGEPDECTDLSEEKCLLEPGCAWEYTGQGVEFQVLVGPAFVVTFTFSALLMGFLADNYSRPKILSFGITVFSVACILMGFSQEFWHLVILRVLIAFGESVCRPAGGSLIIEYFDVQHRAKANGVLSWGVYYGYGLAFLFGTNVVEADILGYGWRSAYVLAGSPGILVAVILFFFKDPRSQKKQLVDEEDKAGENKQVEKKEGLDIWNYLRSLKKGLLQPVMIALLLSAAVRMASGLSWANNNKNYFDQYHEGEEIGIWFMLCSIIGGGCGVLMGGTLSDLLVKKMGIRSRLWLLGAFHIIATPFAVLTLYVSPPWAFACLMGYYFFAETWFAILFTVILELVPENTRGITVSMFLFIMNNIGGNLPVLVEPFTDWIGLQSTLYIFWPGLVFLSGVMFSLSSLTLRTPKETET